MFDEHGRGCMDGRFTNLVDISIKSTGGGTIVSGCCCSGFGRYSCFCVSYAADRCGEFAVLSLSVHSLVGNN